MQTHRFSKPSDIFLLRASLSEGFSRKIAAKILWVMAAHKVGCGLRLPSAVPNRPPLPSKTTPWPESRAIHRHFLRWILGDTSTGERHSRLLISRIIFFYPSPVGYRLRFENGERSFDPGETSVPVSPISSLSLSFCLLLLKVKVQALGVQNASRNWSSIISFPTTPVIETRIKRSRVINNSVIINNSTSWIIRNVVNNSII